jgi:ATP-dependent DNA helicase RecG
MKPSYQLAQTVSAIKGIGPRKRLRLNVLGIQTIEDLLYFFPRDYEDRRNLQLIQNTQDGETVLLCCKITLIAPSYSILKNKRTLRVLMEDESGTLEAIFFNSGYLEKSLKKNTLYALFGKISKRDGRIQMLHPELIPAETRVFQGILPVYRLTEGLSQLEMRKWIREALPMIKDSPEYLPLTTMKRNRLCDINYALCNIHFPEDAEKLKIAKFRLVFEELLLLQTGLFAIRAKINQNLKGIQFSAKIKMQAFIESLPFKLTEAQMKTIQEINGDMESPDPMNRLIQGDVGSGKTIVAAAAIYKAAQSGFQSVLMAPTELLARQHFETFKQIGKVHGFNIDFLSANIKGKQREKLLQDLKDGLIDLLVGTHAVFQKNVLFKSLGLAITDEQHRFGVSQRSLLGSKSVFADVLVMTATPIPRTLAVILYGDLDISIIDEMPPGRKDIITKVIPEQSRRSAYEFIRAELEKGRQAYVVAPVIEDSVTNQLHSVESLYKELCQIFSAYNVELLHGEMKQNDKDQVMDQFHLGFINLLVSTVVIEVGIDVPNASVMLIENAERFGLAQMHQLRGRVGRGKHQSYCLLVTDSDSDVAKQRTQIMQETGDGFLIAEKDLALRGPGDFFGTRQHGVPELRIANLAKHLKLLPKVQEEALIILEEDKQLAQEDHQIFRHHIERLFSEEVNFSL